MTPVRCIGPYRFFFDAGDRDEPTHVHFERDQRNAGFRLDPLRLQKSGGFGNVGLNQIQQLLEKHREGPLQEWNECFDK